MRYCNAAYGCLFSTVICGFLMSFSADASAQGVQQDGFQAGGLAPPGDTHRPPSAPPPSSTVTSTEQDLDKAEEKDSGRGLQWLYFDVEGGVQYVGLETFSSDGLTYAKTTGSSAVGPMFGGGLGIQLLFVTIGGRARMGVFKDWNIASFGGELGFRFPIGSVEPYFDLGGGYAMLAGLKTDTWGGDTKIHGGYVRAGLGLDYYVTSTFSVGGHVSGDVMILSRDGLKGASISDLTPDAQTVASKDGTSVGGALNGTVVLGLHF